MQTIQDLIALLNKLEAHGLCYKLNKVSDHAILIEIAVPGERWEVEILEDGELQIERFRSNGTISGEQDLATLFHEFGA